MKWIKRLTIFLVVVYSGFCLFLYLVQDKIIFNPDQVPENYRFRTGDEIEIEVEKDVFLNCLWMKESENTKAKGVILYLHGNRGDNRRCSYQAETMAGNEYDIFMPDYRGYGKSDGEIYSEKQLFQDVEKVYAFLRKHYEDKQIVLVGYSLGTGMASYLASQHPVQQLVLIAPYVSLTDIKNRRFFFIPDFLLKYNLANEEHLQQINSPVSLFHGTRDRIIPYDSSERLRALNPNLIQLFTVKNEGHRGVLFNGKFRAQLSRLLQ